MGKKASFEILGVKPDASEKEVKRAYFKLIREHSPDKDPEGFKEIRAAYEQMLAPQEDEEKPAFDITDEKAIIVKGRLEEMLQKKEWKDVIKEAEAALVIWPDSSYFKYLLIRAYRGNRNTTKAVKMAEHLSKEDPTNKFFMREYAVSCFDRGFFVKATKPFEKAFQMGVRDFEFLLDRAYALDISTGGGLGSYSRIQNYLDIIEIFKDDPDHFDDVNLIYARIFDIYVSLGFTLVDLSKNLNLDIEGALRFLLDHDVNLEIVEGGKYLLYGLTYLIPEYMDILEPHLMRLFYEALEKYQQDIDEAHYAGMLDIIAHAESIFMDKDPKVTKYFRELAFVWPENYVDDQALMRYDVTDKMLCILKTRNRSFPTLNYIRKTYPSFWQNYPEFLTSLYDDQSSEKIMAQLRSIYRVLSLDYEGGLFYKDFPDERKASVEFNMARTSKFSRPAVGRNEPCPCGSGKKFKKCCMGKRIYD